MIKDDKQRIITTMANICGINLPNDFFALGSLQGSLSLSKAFVGSKGFYGTDDEKKKYDMIMELYEKIVSFCT